MRLSACTARTSLANRFLQTVCQWFNLLQNEHRPPKAGHLPPVLASMASVVSSLYSQTNWPTHTYISLRNYIVRYILLQLFTPQLPSYKSSLTGGTIAVPVWLLVITRSVSMFPWTSELQCSSLADWGTTLIMRWLLFLHTLPVGVSTM